MKTTRTLAILAVFAFAALSCSKEETAPQATPSEPLVHHGLQLTATLEQPSRASLDGYTVKWEAGDCIAVHNGSSWAVSDPLGNEDISVDGRSATFYVTMDEGATYYAVYPASAAPASDPAGDEISVSLPAVQNVPAGQKIAKEALVQVAKATSLADFSFKNAVSLVEFQVPESGISSVYFEAYESGSTALNIAGTGTVNAGTPATVTGDAALVTVNSSSTFTSGQNYFAAVYPQSAVVEGFRFTFTKISVANGAQKAFRTGSLAAAIDLPVNGGKKVTDFDGALNWVGPISDKAELDKWASRATYWKAGETVLLDADIDYEGATWTPVDGRYDSGFAGAIDGQNHSIYNIVMTATTASTGFFDYLTSEAPVQRVKDIKFGYNPGTLAADGTSSLTLSTTVASAKLGVVSGNVTNAIISGVSNYIPVTVSGSSTASQLGGLVGRAEGNCSFSSCTNYADIKFNSSGLDVYVGGVISVIAGNGSTVSECHNYGTVQRIKGTGASSSETSGNTFIGGVLGRTGKNCHGISMTGCRNHGMVGTTANIKAAQIYVGGITSMDNASENEDPNLTLESCYNDVDGTVSIYNQSIASEAGFGGIIGDMKNHSSITDCHNLGAVIKAGNFAIQGKFGGIVGILEGASSSVVNCNNGSSANSAYGSVTDNAQTSTGKNQRIGGVVGIQTAGTINNCRNYGKVWTKSTTASIFEYVGGIVGNHTVGAITNCSGFGPIVVAGTTAKCSAGGLIGLQSGGTAVSTLTGCSVSAELSCGYAANTGLVVGLYTSTNTTELGSSESPVSIASSSTVNGNAISNVPWK